MCDMDKTLKGCQKVGHDTKMAYYLILTAHMEVFAVCILSMTCHFNSVLTSIYLSDLCSTFPQISIISKALYKHSLKQKIYRQEYYLTVITLFE